MMQYSYFVKSNIVQFLLTTKIFYSNSQDERNQIMTTSVWVKHVSSLILSVIIWTFRE